MSGRRSRQLRKAFEGLRGTVTRHGDTYKIPCPDRFYRGFKRWAVKTRKSLNNPLLKGKVTPFAWAVR